MNYRANRENSECCKKNHPCSHEDVMIATCDDKVIKACLLFRDAADDHK